MSNVETPLRLVVRTYAPARRVFTLVAVGLLVLLSLYLVFETGRYRAGFDSRAAAGQRSKLNAQIEALEKTNRELRVQLASLDTGRIGQSREREEMGRSIGDLQAQVSRQAQQLAFYQGIVGQGVSGKDSAPVSDVRIQQLQIDRGSAPAKFHIKVTLAHAGKQDVATTGAIALHVEGRSGGKDVSLALEALSDPAPSELPFNFRYFQNFDREVTIPAGFEPERIAVEVRSNRRGAAPLKQVFLWNINAK